MKQVIVPERIEGLATAVVDAAYSVHKAFGPGLLESVYQECLAIEMAERGLPVVRETSVPLVYRGRTIERAYRADMIVGGALVLELKAIEAIQPIHRVQLTTYLRLLKLPLGLLINFNVPLIRDGITRVLNLDFQAEVNAEVAVPSLASSRLRA